MGFGKKVKGQPTTSEGLEAQELFWSWICAECTMMLPQSLSNQSLFCIL